MNLLLMSSDEKILRIIQILKDQNEISKKN